MTIEVDIEDLINLVNGVSPAFSVMDEPNINNSSYYDDNKGWLWDKRKLRLFTEGELYSIYHTCKNSWK